MCECKGVSVPGGGPRGGGPLGRTGGLGPLMSRLLGCVCQVQR